MSITDRIRTENMRANMAASPASTSSHGSDRGPFDSAEARRMNTALEEPQGLLPN